MPRLPVIVGSGVTAANLATFAPATALIVGSHFKEGGRWEGEVDRDRVLEVMEEARRCRG